MIKRIYLLVHPLFNILGNEKDIKIPLHRIEAELLEEWSRLCIEVSHDPDSLCIVFSAIDRSFIQNLLSESPSPEDSLDIINAKEHALQVERFLKSKVGENFLILRANHLPQSEELSEICARKNLVFDEDITILAFGEYYESCVKGWGEELGLRLEKLGHNVRVFRLPNLSLDGERLLQIVADWDSYKLIPSRSIY